MRSARPYLLCIWFIGLASIPMSMVPAQVFNYLTGVLQSGNVVSYSSIWPIILLFFLCRSGIAFLEVVRTMLNGYYLELIVRDFTLRVFDRVLRISPDFFRRHDAAKISNRVIRDTRTVEAFFLSLKANIPLAAIGLLSYAYVLFFGLSSNTPVIGSMLGSHSQQGSWLLGVLIICLSPIQSYFLLFDKKIQRVTREAAIAGDNIVSTAHETIAGITEIRNNNAFFYAMKRVRKVFDFYREIQLQMTQLSAIFKGVGPMINAFVNCVLLAIGALLCLGDITIPVLGVTVHHIRWQDYLGFMFMAMAVHGYVGSMMRFFFRWRMTKQTIKRVDEYLESPIIFQEDDAAPEIDASRDKMEFDNIDFETSLGTRILNNLNLSIKPGEHVAFVGPSGSGKSTAMNLLVRDIFPTSGRVAFAGKPLPEYNFASLTSQVGFVQQDPVLFNMSLRDNILFGLRHSLASKNGRRTPDAGQDQAQDARLIQVVESVGLIKDMIGKALDNPCPPRFIQTSLILSQRTDLKQAVAQAVAGSDSDMVQFFDPEKYLEQGTVLENLIWGISREDAGADKILDEKQTGFTREIFRVLENSPLLDQLVNLGRWRFAHDRNAGALIKLCSPRLYAILSAYGKQDIDMADTFDGEQAFQDMADTNTQHQIVLLEVALETNAGLAASYFAGPGGYVKNILEARKKITADPFIKSLDMDSFDQDRSVHGLTMREILLGGRVNSKIRGSLAQVDSAIAEELEKASVLDELVFMGLEYNVGVGGQNLSGGQIMKVALARTIMKNPNILLLDEVMAPLDKSSRTGIERLINDEFSDKTVISVSHNLSVLKGYDRILVFDRGQVVQDGTYDSLYSTPGLFQTLAMREQGRAAPSQVEEEKTRAWESATEKITELQRVIALSPTFSSLNIKQIAMLERLAQTTTCGKDTVLFNKGDAGSEFFIVLDGQVELFVERKKDGQQVPEIIAVLGPGQAFGELALFGGVPRTLGARAKTELRLCSIIRDDLIQLIKTNPEIAVMLLQTASQRIARMMEHKPYGQ